MFYDILPFIISTLGFAVSIQILFVLKKISHDKILMINFCSLGAVDMYIGIVYLLFIFHIIPSLQDLSHFLRPVNLLQIAIPSFIIMRMGAAR
ncbi:hypothetical protein AXF24_13285 [Streptococcus pneumoniae]|nr:hypothetical protein AWW74_13295 [Streptococcus pneumoniae]KXB96044.1 hypothetical protein AXF24_13285 [Streptococcus pneumoniae]